MSQIMWTTEELRDPYPAILQTVGEVLRANTDAVGESEDEVLSDIIDSILSVLMEKDPASLRIFTGPTTTAP